jgi:hypothetical protein
MTFTDNSSSVKIKCHFDLLRNIGYLVEIYLKVAGVEF